MTSCGPSYSVTNLPVDPGTCGTKCADVSFTIDSVTSKFTEEGVCEFEWEVTRTTPTGSTTFAGDTAVACPGSKIETFYCDPGKNCARLQLNFFCNADSGPPGA